MTVTSLPKVFAAETVVNMNIYEDTVTRSVEREMYGINYEWSTGTGDSFVTDENGNYVLNPNFGEAWKGTLTFGRQAGSSSQEIKWKDAIGPTETRKKQSLWGMNGTVYRGIVEWLQLLYSATPDVQIVYTVNLDSDTLENMADIVEFLVGDGTVNYNGGTNWAAERKRLGIENPVKVWAWEIGNEMDLIGWDAERYAQYCKKVIPIIKSIDPNAKISCHAHTSVSTNRADFAEWHRTVLKAVGKQIDYMSIHYYYQADFVSRGDPAFDALEKDIRELTGSDYIKLYFSEQAPWPNSLTYNKDNPFDYTLPHTIWGATAQAELYLRFMMRTSVAATTCHSAHSAAWCIGYVDDDGMYHLSPTGQMMKTFANYGVGDVLKSELGTFESGKESNLNIAGAAIRDDNGNINVIFTNRNETEPVTVKFNFGDGAYRIKHIRRVHGDVKGADDWYRPGSQWTYNNTNKVRTTDEDIADGGIFTSYTFDALSVYAIQLEKAEDIDGETLARANAKKHMAFSANSGNVFGYGKVENCAENGKSVPTIERNDTIMISSEQLEERFGAVLAWNDDGSICTAQIGDRSLTFDIANGAVYENGAYSDIMPAVRADGRTYFPLRSLAAVTGYEVKWDERGFAVVYLEGASPDSAAADYIYRLLMGGQIF